MIPKIIHYCWFGRNEKSDLIKKCISSWQKYCPDFEIKEWNEDNFDISCCPYVSEAYQARKWAFVSDFCRFQVLFEYGGIYMDTDVELLKPIDSLLGESFVGFEDNEHIAPGLIMGCEKGNQLCKDMIEEYTHDNFIKEGNLNCLTVCDRVTKKLVEMGLVRDGSYQEIYNFKVYPTEFFNPIDRRKNTNNLTLNSYSVHHYAATWVDNEYLFRTSNLNGKIMVVLRSIFGDKISKAIWRVFRKS
ncbi:MAG: mannosyltransferase [Bacillales bacterium]|jgi:mannosyltransferase OCH1-like enzyme|nr:mannosyltransferase [Bacillales bacterium]